MFLPIPPQSPFEKGDFFVGRGLASETPSYEKKVI